MQNLKQLFSRTSASQTADVIRLHGDLVTLFKRSGSNQWQCGFKLPNGQWHSASTFQTDLELAKQSAVASSDVIPASELAKRKQEEEERAKAFTRAAADEEFVNRTERSVSPDCPTPAGQRVGVVTREPFEDLP